MKTYIHVNRQILVRNRRNQTREPAITVRTYKGVRQARSVTINGPCRVVHAEDKPLKNGARVWVETEAPVEVTP